ncbi:hypothetical protein PSE10A_59880 [Pseudomonas amygdali pv. eriobotryae]|uniref:Uncharacterized protein n=1 Tax=Pseudomonas amygdali pv. eriobotryae TaxID=129137 RepID=A0A9P3AKS3_PSEA0|nr:hypothetical protein PSE10A_59880 [Pseudomonas amygdali pv. eriobotryae]
MTASGGPTPAQHSTAQQFFPKKYPDHKLSLGTGPSNLTSPDAGAIFRS